MVLEAIGSRLGSHLKVTWWSVLIATLLPIIGAALFVAVAG